MTTLETIFEGVITNMKTERKIELLLKEAQLKIVEHLIEYTDIESADVEGLKITFDDLLEEIINLIKG